MEYKGLEIGCVEDCGDNEGGYFCEVYTIEPVYDRIDFFSIHPEELRENPDTEYWQRKYIDEELIASTEQEKKTC